jgi:hypothetical protein
VSDKDKRLVEFEKLNLVGKAVFVTGTTFRFVGDLLNSVAETVVELLSDAEKAFVEGSDPNVDDAKIVGESDEDMPEKDTS